MAKLNISEDTLAMWQNDPLTLQVGTYIKKMREEARDNMASGGCRAKGDPNLTSDLYSHMIGLVEGLEDVLNVFGVKFE